MEQSAVCVRFIYEVCVYFIAAKVHKMCAFLYRLYFDHTTLYFIRVLLSHSRRSKFIINSSLFLFGKTKKPFS